MKEHWKYKINWIGFPKTHRKVAGVYKIGDVYVGASKHIRERIIMHFGCAINGCFYPNQFTKAYIMEMIESGKPIDVELLSTDPMDERIFCEKLKLPGNAAITARYYDQLYGIKKKKPMKLYKLTCINEDGRDEENGYFLKEENAKARKAELDSQPRNIKYGIVQYIVEIEIED